jgi:hypothetical protein
VAVANVEPPKPQADAGQAPARKKAKPRVARVSVDPGDEDVAIIRPKRNNSLRNLFGLFGSDDDDAPKQKKMKKKKRKDTAGSKKPCFLFCG